MNQIMQTNIRQLNPAEYELEIEAPAGAFSEEIDRALRLQRQKTQMKGFRPGKVPLQLVRKMYGEAIAFGIVEKKVQETYESTVSDNDEYDVLGRPLLTELEFSLDAPLKAIVRFGVRPEIELADVSAEEISRLKMEVDEETIDRQVHRLRTRHAELVPMEEGEGLGEEDQAKIDLQPIDDASGTPIIGAREEDVTFFLDDEKLKDDLREAMLGRKEGETFRVELEHEEEHGDHTHTHRHTYEVTVKEARHRRLPELDEEFIKRMSNDMASTEDELRDYFRREIEIGWQKQAQELVDSQIVERMLALHEFDVPTSVVEMYLDSFIEDVKQRNENKLPESFDEASFREENREEAFSQAKWMLIRDRVIDEAGIALTEEDRERELVQNAAQMGVGVELLQQYYQAMPQLNEQFEQRALSRKVFDHLTTKFTVVDRTSDEFRKMREDENAGKETGSDETEA
jgi:trigger factor